MPIEGRLQPQKLFREEKRLWIAALEAAGSVPELDNVEDAMEIGVCPKTMQLLSFENKINLQTRKMWFAEGKGFFLKTFKTRHAILGQDKVVGHVWVWLQHVTL